MLKDWFDPIGLPLDWEDLEGVQEMSEDISSGYLYDSYFPFMHFVLSFLFTILSYLHLHYGFFGF